MSRTPRIFIGGEPISALAARHGISYDAIRTRHLAGLTGDALVAPVQHRGNTRLIEGATLVEHATRSGVNQRTLRQRLHMGATLADALDPTLRAGRPLHAPDALDEAIWCERLGADGPTATQPAIAARFGVTRQTVSLRERALRGEQ